MICGLSIRKPMIDMKELVFKDLERSNMKTREEINQKIIELESIRQEDFRNLDLFDWEWERRQSLHTQRLRMLKWVLENEENILRDLPDYVDHMTMDQFVQACKSNFFIDYDGNGHYATDTQVSNKSVVPSDVTTGMLDGNPRWTHIVWYNK